MDTRSHHSLEEFDAICDAWDDLWRRCGYMFPSSQSAFVSQWMRHFASDERFHAIAVEDSGKLQAALPLTVRRWKKLITIASLPGNEWSPIGNLMVEFNDDTPQSISALVDLLSNPRWSLAQFEPVRLDAIQWQMFIARLRQAGYPLNVETLFEVGQVDVDGDWNTYLKSRSRNLRKDLGKAWRRLETLGSVEVRRHTQPDGNRLAELMRLGFEVEDRSWKSRTGTSVLKVPGMLEYYTSQAALLRDREQLQLSVLTIDERPIAFEYGWHGHGTYFSFKVGYDETFERHSPGQLLRMKLLEHFFTDENTTVVDFFGPLNRALAAWSTSSIPIGRLTIGRPSLCGRGMIGAYRQLRSLCRKCRKGKPQAEFKLRSHPSKKPNEETVETSELLVSGN